MIEVIEIVNWPAIEGIASVAGAVGVIISIIFLIYEVRHNARAIEGATVQSLMSHEQEVFSILSENAELMTKGGADPASLTEVEVYRYERGVGTHMSLIYSAHMQLKRGLVEDEVWDVYVDALKRNMQAVGFAGAWSHIAIGYPKSFRDSISEKFP